MQEDGIESDNKSKADQEVDLIKVTSITQKGVELTYKGRTIFIKNEVEGLKINYNDNSIYIGNELK